MRAMTPSIRAGLQIPIFDYPGVDDVDLFETVAAIATTAEDSGFDSVWTMDHFNQITGRPSDRMLETYALLGALAARTSRVNLGSLVTGVTYRNPAMLAKQVTTLDVLSRGRAIFGIGAGWFEHEHTAFGYDFPSARERLDRLEEAVQIARLMFTEESPSFQGTYYSIVEAFNRPRPIRPDGIPILIGGGGERRTLGLVAQYADACNVGAAGDAARAKIDALARHCDELGRDIDSINKTLLRTVVIGATSAEAVARGDAMRAAMGIPEDRFSAMVVQGDPSAVAEYLAAELKLGFDGVIMNIAGVQSLDTIALAGDAMRMLA